jgi:DNA polymerase III epsilon subunit-like protein
MKQFALFIGEWHPRYQNFRWHSLANALRAVGQTSPAHDHRALTDAESCRRVVEAMASGVRADIPALRPDVIERDSGVGWTSETRTIPGGQVTVVSSSGGCSTGLLLVILLIGAAFILLGCCAFFYFMMITS